ncbi:MAG: glycosyltransferase family 9 protein [Verrucomicrobiota bacterium]|nr:glycosyltransferase family 9 protein [Verrucomicrobiota bacterium]
MTRILVFRGGAVGDFILTLPVFDALRRRWPRARIKLVGYPRVKRLAFETKLADEFESLDSPDAARLFAPELALRKGKRGKQKKEEELGVLCDLLSGIPSFDLVLSYLHDPDGVVRENFVRAGAKRLVCASPIVASGHAVNHLLQPLAELGIEVRGGETPRLRLPENGGKTAQGDGYPIEAEKNRFCLHPGSGSPKKNWPAEKFAELARRIRGDKLGSPFFSLGEADNAIGEALARLAPDIPVLRGLDLLDLAGVLATCAGYIGNDSGITHLAAAVGIPVVALFGPTDPQVWGPAGENVLAREPTTESLEQLGLEPVLMCLRKALEPVMK